MSIKKLLIANRGEIALRIIRAAQELGIRTVQVYSDADKDSLPVKLADEAVNIGKSQASKSYLSIDAILTAAKKTKVDAIHPGYGFFAESAEFAAAVIKAGIIFIGPSADIINKMGDKVAARQCAIAAGVPIVPGSDGRIDDMQKARELAKEIGFPLMIKAAAGGGGRGIRVITNIEEFDKMAPQASTEAKAAFGDGGIYIEKFIDKSRHIEVQILADGKNVVHFFERECSLQRRRQKILEEAPAVILSQAMREKLCNCAVALAKHVNYKGAGTVEYIFDSSTNGFYFIEMNTRIQVEHPITEMITGFDLVREMISIAAGNELNISQNDIAVKGHAIEVRINAEDYRKNFAPQPGVITGLRVPGGAGVRFDSVIFSGYEVSPFYDSLLAKLIVWDVDRASAIRRMRRALNELNVSGIATTKELFQVLLNNKDVINGDFDTLWLENFLKEECK